MCKVVCLKISLEQGALIIIPLNPISDWYLQVSNDIIAVVIHNHIMCGIT